MLLLHIINFKVIIGFFLFLSCVHKRENVFSDHLDAHTQVFEKLDGVKIDTIIVFQDIANSDLYSSIQIQTFTGSDYLLMNYCYEDSLKILGINNMELKSFKRNLNTNTCMNKSSFNYHENSLISVNHTNEKIYFSKENTLIDSIDLNANGVLEDQDIYVDTYLPYCTQNINLSESVIYIRILPHRSKVKYKTFDEKPFLLRFNASNGKYDIIKLFNKRIIGKGRPYGYLDFYYLINRMNNVIVSYPSDGEIDIFDLDSLKWKKLIKPSRFDTGFVFYDKKKKEDTKDAKILHNKLSHEYHSLTYNQYTEKYYRIFSKALNRYDEKGFATNEEEREYILMVFDLDFNLIDEIELPNINSFYALLPIENGVLINIVQETKEAFIAGVSVGKNYKYLRIRHD